MRLSDFDFHLPDRLIATRPVRPRSQARLLVAQGGMIHDQHVTDLASWLHRGDRLVLNDTAVIPGRLEGMRTRLSAQGPAQAKIQVTLLHTRSDGHWCALIKPLRKLRVDENIVFSQDLSARLVAIEAGQAILAFDKTGAAFDAALAQVGMMPLPPYIASKRAADAQDHTDYQTIWAQKRGAVAAPTASLHFDQMVMDALQARGVQISYVTLHVGAGTFLPVKVDDIADHKMHAEWGEVSAQACAEIAQTRRRGGRIIPVGTTALRLIESAGRSGEIKEWRGPTDIFITPGFKFAIADGLMTNFHLPKSTLMMLVSALMGMEKIAQIYAHAIAHEYRFFSYGDASLLLPPKPINDAGRS